MSSKLEKMMKIAADSHQMDGWDDSLSFIVNSSKPALRLMRLDEEDLQQVAGGAIRQSPELSEKLKRTVLGNEK